MALAILTATPMDNITAQISTLTTVFGEIWTLMTSNPYLCVFLASGLIFVGVRIFKRFKRM